MDIEVLQENLNSALNSVCRIVGTHSQIPILSHVYLEAGEGKLVLVASNAETTIRTQIGAKVNVEGKFTVPAKTLQETIASLSPDKLSMVVAEGQLLIKSKNFKGKINGTPGEEYPLMANYQGVPRFSWSLDSVQFAFAIGKTVFSSATDESRAVLTGVALDYFEGVFRFAATDGFRLSVVSFPYKLEGEKFDRIIVPARSLQEISKSIVENVGKKEKSFVELSILEDGQLLAIIGETRIVSRIITGNFPDYARIIPANYEAQIQTPVDQLLKTLRVASIFARDSANIVKLRVSNGDDKLVISANAAQVGENVTDLEVEYLKKASEDFDVAFNYRYLLDFVGSVEKGKDVLIELISSTAAGVFRVKGENSYLHIIMPVRVQS